MIRGMSGVYTGAEMSGNTMKARARNILALAICLVSCYAAAALGGLASADVTEGWYAELERPSWTPPSWLFGPVWTALYGMMAVAAWLIWLGPRPAAALVAFGVQLALNAAWTPLFFGLHRIDLALADIGLLWLVLALTTVMFFKRRAVAGVLLLPYLLWVSFATYLNYSIATLNP